jgi:hypothetical protein
MNIKKKNFYTLPKRLLILSAVLASVFLFKNKLRTYVNGKASQGSAASLWLKNVSQTSWQAELLGSSRQKHLVLTTLNKSYQYNKSDQAILFKKFSLPPAIVEIRFIADIAYYVDLEKTFKLEAREDKVLVLAPLLEFQRPSVDLRTLKFEVKQKGFLIDEKKTLEKLQAELPLFLHDDAIKSLDQVREKARTELIEFLQNWFLKSELKAPTLELVFEDEWEENKN